MSKPAPMGLEPIPVTVTYLEMAAAPVHYPPLPFGSNVALLKARNIPCHFYRYLMDRVGRPWHWVNMLRLEDSALQARLAEPQREITSLYLDGAPAGFFEIAPAKDNRIEIAYFGLMPHATGRGLGRWFLGAAIAEAWSSNPQAVTVETCTLDHPAALSLYQKLGFSPVAQGKGAVTPLSVSERHKILGQ